MFFLIDVKIENIYFIINFININLHYKQFLNINRNLFLFKYNITINNYIRIYTIRLYINNFRYLLKFKYKKFY